MKEIMHGADLANQFIDKTAPWAVAKEDSKKAAQLCTAGLNACRYLMIFLKPVLPTIVKGIEEFFNISELSWKDLNTTLTNHKINPYKHLASRIVLEDVEKIVETF